MKRGILFLLLTVLLFSCSKNFDKLTLRDYLSKDSMDIKQRITDELGDTALIYINNAIERYKLYNNFDKKQKLSINKVVKEQKEYNLKIKPRQELYNIAVKELKSNLKVPSSARISKLLLENTDSVSIRKDTTFKDSSHYEVKIHYQAQNLFGVYLDGVYYSLIEKDSTGKFSEWYGYSN